MKKLMNILVLSCKKASGLIEKKIHFSLSRIEKVQLFLHTSMCDSCKGWEKQSKDIDSTIKNHLHTNARTNDIIQEGLSEQVKQSIIKKLEEK